MAPIDKLVKIAKQYERGILTERELRWVVTDVICEYGIAVKDYYVAPDCGDPGPDCVEHSGACD